MQTTGIIYDLKKYAIHDGPGIRTTVFLKGCPLDCWWCHNPESRKNEPQSSGKKNLHKNLALLNSDKNLIGIKVTTNEVMHEIRKDVLFYDESGGGVTFSGGEPLQQTDFLKMLLAECKAEHIHTVVDTSGYVEYKYFEEIRSLTDLFLYDLKFIDDALHLKYTGVSNRLMQLVYRKFFKSVSHPQYNRSIKSLPDEEGERKGQEMGMRNYETSLKNLAAKKGSTIKVYEVMEGKM